MEILSQLIPSFSHGDSDIGQRIAPGQSADECKNDEAWKVHPGNARWKGNEGPHHRQQTAEKNSGFSVFCKPAIGGVEIAAGEEHIRPIAFNERSSAP